MSRETRRLELWTLARAGDGMGKIVAIYSGACGIVTPSPLLSGMINSILDAEFPKPTRSIAPPTVETDSRHSKVYT